MTATMFRTTDGLRVPAVTTDQMREIDRIAIQETGPNLYQMMENAGRNLAELCMDSLGPTWTQAHIVVLAGTGGNGGGGICAARHLANHGGSITLVLSNRSGLHHVPAEQFSLYLITGAPAVDVDGLGGLSPDLIVDAVLGYSALGAPHGASAELIAWASQQTAPVVSLDVPSGIDATIGRALGEFVSASDTMTLALPKIGLDSGAVGALWVADIGIPRSVYSRIGIRPPTSLFQHGYRVRLEPATT